MFFSILLNQSLLPTGNALCPEDGCRVLDPTSLDGGLEGLPGLVVTITNIATYILAAMAVLWIVYAAFQFLIGGEKGGEKGRKIIINALIAIVIAISAPTLIQILINFLDTFQL